MKEIERLSNAGDVAMQKGNYDLLESIEIEEKNARDSLEEIKEALLIDEHVSDDPSVRHAREELENAQAAFMAMKESTVRPRASVMKDFDDSIKQKLKLYETAKFKAYAKMKHDTIDDVEADSAVAAAREELQRAQEELDATKKMVPRPKSSVLTACSDAVKDKTKIYEEKKLEAQDLKKRTAELEPRTADEDTHAVAPVPPSADDALPVVPVEPAPLESKHAKANEAKEHPSRYCFALSWFIAFVDNALASFFVCGSLRRSWFRPTTGRIWTAWSRRKWQQRRRSRSGRVCGNIVASRAVMVITARESQAVLEELNAIGRTKVYLYSALCI